MLRPFDHPSQQCCEVLWHVETSLNSFKLCLNIVTKFILFLKCWEVVEAVWPGMVSTCHNMSQQMLRECYDKCCDRLIDRALKPFWALFTFLVSYIKYKDVLAVSEYVKTIFPFLIGGIKKKTRLLKNKSLIWSSRNCAPHQRVEFKWYKQKRRETNHIS